MRLQLLTKKQTFDLFDQMEQHLKHNSGPGDRYLEFWTVHKLRRGLKVIFVEVEWIFLNLAGDNPDVFITRAGFIKAKEYYEVLKGE